MKKSILKFLVIFCMIIIVYSTFKRYETLQVFSDNGNETETETIKILIDAGHGGIDPGKVGINEALEKDINLSISLKLKSLFEKDGIQIVMTRETDDGLYSEDDNEKKKVDMRNRKQMMIDEKPNIILSIHQNSFESENVKGAQVFYFNQSEDSKLLAEFIQTSLREKVDNSNNRQIKANDTYYLLKTNICPMVIVECGFLSNWEEAKLLITDEYQDKIANAIYEGVLLFLNR